MASDNTKFGKSWKISVYFKINEYSNSFPGWKLQIGRRGKRSKSRVRFVWFEICMEGNHFSKFYGKVGDISWSLFHLIRKNYVLYWEFDLKSWIVAFFTRFTRFTLKKRPQNNFSRQNFSVENNYLFNSIHRNYYRKAPVLTPKPLAFLTELMACIVWTYMWFNYFTSGVGHCVVSDKYTYIFFYKRRKSFK